jgi:hypothetical protein
MRHQYLLHFVIMMSHYIEFLFINLASKKLMTPPAQELILFHCMLDIRCDQKKTPEGVFGGANSVSVLDCRDPDAHGFAWLLAHCRDALAALVAIPHAIATDYLCRLVRAYPAALLLARSVVLHPVAS